MPVFESVARAWALRSAFEVRLLRLSVVATAALALAGVLLGFLSGSLAIMFDGLFSLIDAAIALLMLAVARLVASEGNRRFQFGYWHLEPMVLGFKASVLVILVGYGALNAVQVLLAGGNAPQLGMALAYSALTTIACFLMWFYLRYQNTRLESELVRLDQHGWIMSGLISAALLAGFLLSAALRVSPLDHLVPLIDPAILALISVALLPVPLREAIRAAAEIFEAAPAGLDAEVRGVMTAFVQRHGFTRFVSYVSKVGRARFIEVSILVPENYPAMTVAHFDALRQEVAESFDGPNPDLWLTIVFTADETQL